MEKRTRHGRRERGKRDRGIGRGRKRRADVEMETRRGAALVFIRRRKTKKTKKQTHREVKSSFPILFMPFKGLVSSWGISQHALGTRQGNILGSDPPDLYVFAEGKEEGSPDYGDTTPPCLSSGLCSKIQKLLS